MYTVKRKFKKCVCESKNCRKSLFFRLLGNFRFGVFICEFRGWIGVRTLQVPR